MTPTERVENRLFACEWSCNWKHLRLAPPGLKFSVFLRNWKLPGSRRAQWIDGEHFCTGWSGPVNVYCLWLWQAQIINWLLMKIIFKATIECIMLKNLPPPYVFKKITRGVCLSQSLYCCDKNPLWSKSNMERKGLFYLPALRFYAITYRSQNWKSRVEPGVQKLKQRPWGNAAYCLASWGLLSLDACSLQDHQPMGGTTRLHQSSVKTVHYTFAHKPICWDIYLSWGSFFSNESSWHVYSPLPPLSFLSFSWNSFIQPF